MYWTCTVLELLHAVSMINETNPAWGGGGGGEGEKGDALIFRILFRQTHFFSLSFLSEDSQRPVHLWKYHGPRDLFPGYGEH